MPRTLARLLPLFAAGWLFAAVAPDAAGQLKADQPRFDVINRLRDMKDGSKSYKDPISSVAKQNEEELNALTQWLAFRLTQAELYGDKPESGPRLPGINGYPEAVDDILKYMAPTDGSKKLSQPQWDYNIAFGEHLAKHLAEVMKHQKMIVRVNAARMLGLAGKSGAESLADVYVKMIEDPAELEAAKFYAIQGLGHLLSIKNQLQPGKPYIAKEDRLIRVAETLVGLIEGKKSQTPAMEPEVLRFFRREACRSLAGFPFGVLRDVNARPGIAPAHTLMKVALRDASLSSPPSVSEQLEALISFCQLPIDDEMNLDFAAAVLNAAVVDMGRYKNSGSKALPWKLSAARLGIAMNQLKASAKKVQAARNPQTLVGAIDAIFSSVLTPLEKGDQIDVDGLRNGQVVPQTDKLISDIEGSKLVPPPAAGG